MSRPDVAVATGDQCSSLRPKAFSSQDFRQRPKTAKPTPYGFTDPPPTNWHQRDCEWATLILRRVYYICSQSLGKAGGQRMVTLRSANDRTFFASPPRLICIFRFPFINHHFPTHPFVTYFSSC